MKRNLVLLIVFLAGCALLKAQTNIAPQATASASTCNTGACATLNDQNYGNCGTQSMWITSAANNPGSTIFIQFVWSSTKVINKITFHVGEQANRFLGGGTIQVWNGTAWVNHATFTQATGVCSYSVNFAGVATDRVRIIDIVVIGAQSSNVNFREIEIYGPNYQHDAGVSAFTNLTTCVSPQSLNATVSNFGVKKLDSFRLHWSVNNTFMGTQYITSNLNTGASMSINVSASFNYTPSTVYNFKVWTSYPNGKVKDSGVLNDTLYYKAEYLGPPGQPTVADFKQCGQGKVAFTGTPDHPADSIVWFAQSSGGTPVALGKNSPGPFITQTTTFYAQSIKMSKLRTTLSNTATASVSATQANEYGTMFNITAINNFLLDSLLVRLIYATPTNMGYQLYYKAGTYAGFQTNAAAWTKINQGATTIFAASGSNYAKISAKSLFLYAGQTYSFYLATDLTMGSGNAFFHTSAAPTVSNVDLSLLTGGSIIVGKFGLTSVTANYLPDVTFIYRKECVSASRLPVTVTVKPRPIGASVIPGGQFEGQFRLGNLSFPDVLEVNKTNTYELLPPTGYTNSGHASTWSISSIVAKSKTNVTIPSTDYVVVLPSASGSGTLTFKPKSIYLDSLITFTISFSDLGPHFCDSTISRTIYIAPTPKTNFKLPSAACSRNEAIFDNITTIYKGFVTYMWYFGDGDSADVHTPAHEYALPGTYQVRLRATSAIWNVVKDTVLTLVVKEKPKVEFNMVNRCYGQALTMINNTKVMGGIPLAYTWHFGDGTTTNTTSSASFNKAYPAAGTYKVKLVADNNGCKDSLTRNAYQFLRPKANFEKNTGVCLNEPFTFSNTSTDVVGEYGNAWDFDDNGNISSDLVTTYTFTAAGTKNVKLKVISEFGCTDSIIKPILVRQSPLTDFSYPFACEKTPTPFKNLTNIYNEGLIKYTWNFGQGAPSNVTNPIVSWTSLGKKTVTLKTELANGCSSEITKTLDVGVQPNVDFEFEHQCKGSEAIFTNRTTHKYGEIKYNWSFGDGKGSIVPSPTYAYNDAQTFFVTLKASIINGCTDSITKSISITALPTTCDFDFKRNWAKGMRNFDFTPKGGSMAGIKYTWLMGDGNKVTSNGAGVSYTYNSTLRYCVTMEAINQGDCECSATNCLDVDGTGVNDIRSSGFIIFPNPSTGIFHISSAEGTDNMKVSVFNMLGELVKTYSFAGSSESVMDLTGLDSGIYTVNIQDNDHSVTQKINIVK